MCVLSPGLFWGGGVNNVFLSVSMKYCASCLLWGGGRGGNNVLLSVSMKYSVLVVSCGVVGGQQCLIVSCTLAYVTSHHLTPSVSSYIFKRLFPIPWFVACWFPSIPSVVSLSRDKNIFCLCLLQVRCSVRMSCVLICFFSAYIMHLGWVWVGGWVGRPCSCNFQLRSRIAMT